MYSVLFINNSLGFQVCEDSFKMDIHHACHLVSENESGEKSEPLYPLICFNHATSKDYRTRFECFLP